MIRPVRLQLSRARGFRLQALSLETNGLPAVNVARPSKWGNRWKVRAEESSGGVVVPAITVETAVAMFRQDYESALYSSNALRRAAMVDALRELRGHNLACWCPLGAPCHADVLLELANGLACERAG